MKTKFKRVDANSEEYEGDECYFSMSEINHKLGMEILKRQEGPAIFTQSNPIDSIVIKGNYAISQITLYFGNFAHIHLSREQLKAFVEGLNKVYEHITFDEYTKHCDDCDVEKTFKPKTRLLIDEIPEYRCPSCGKLTRDGNIKNNLWFSEGEK